MPKMISEKTTERILSLGASGQYSQAAIAERAKVSLSTVARLLSKPRASSKNTSRGNITKGRGFKLSMEGTELLIRVNIGDTKIARSILRELSV